MLREGENEFLFGGREGVELMVRGKKHSLGHGSSCEWVSGYILNGRIAKASISFTKRDLLGLVQISASVSFA